MLNSNPTTLTNILWFDDQRLKNFEAWLAKITPLFSLNPASLRLASSDASFRRYLEIYDTKGQRHVIMDSPPEKENNAQYVLVQKRMASAGLKVPHVFDWDEPHGFLLLSSLGHHTVLQCLQADPKASSPYLASAFDAAIDSLLRWQLNSQPDILPNYDKTILKMELSRFPEWYLGAHKKITLDPKDAFILEQVFERIISYNLSSAMVFVHRDFMFRNMMVGDLGLAKVSAEGLGILDFQDALYGPITYDIACLVRDAFISWEEDICLDIVVRYWQRAKKIGLPVDADFGTFYQAVEWMGLQRHLKIAGLFARLTLRDHKPPYLADVPRFIAYIRATCARYHELTPLLRLIDKIENIKPNDTYFFGRP